MHFRPRKEERERERKRGRDIHPTRDPSITFDVLT